MILGAEISDISPSEAVKTARGFLASQDQHYIVTPNPEIVLKAFKSAKLRFILDHADLSLPDGFGLKIAARLLGQKLHNRVAGADFMLKLGALAEEESRGVFLLGGAPGVAQKAAARLQEKYPGIKIAGAISGGKVRKINNEWVASEAGLIEKINQSRAQILFVAFGCPKQEKWLYHNLSKLESVKLAMTVGGSFDFLAGTVRRAPAIMRQIGLEWMWRFFQDPRRAPRIWNATIGFLWKVLAAKWRMAFVYRHNVVGFITNNKNEILLVQRANEKREHWQLPQGGVDKGESEEQAVLREMREEVGAVNLKILGKHPKKYSYVWSRWHQLRGSYRGQRQTIFYLRFDQSRDSIKLDQHEIRDYQWVPIEQALKFVHPMRRNMVKMAMEGYWKIVS